MLDHQPNNSGLLVRAAALAAGVGQTLTVDDTSATSLYLTDDGVADAINTLYASSPRRSQ